MIKKWIGIRERIQEWTITDFLKINGNINKNWTTMRKSVIFLTFWPLILQLNTEVKILIIREGLVYRRLSEIGIVGSE